MLILHTGALDRRLGRRVITHEAVENHIQIHVDVWVESGADWLRRREIGNMRAARLAIWNLRGHPGPILQGEQAVADDELFTSGSRNCIYNEVADTRDYMRAHEARITLLFPSATSRPVRFESVVFPANLVRATCSMRYPTRWFRFRGCGC